MLTINTYSPEETWNLASLLAPLLSEGDVINLSGDLGAGKTVFTKGLAAGLGITEPVTSPTFTIIKEYKGRIPLYHFDVYRLFDPDELFALGADEYFYGDGISVVEWGDRIEDLLPEAHLTIEMYRVGDHGKDFTRILKIIPHGEYWRSKVKDWFKGSDIDDFSD